MGCASGADALRADYVRYLERVPEMAPYPEQMVEFFRLVRRAINARDPELCRQAARSFHEYGVATVPTLVANAGPDPQGFVADAERMGLLPPSVRPEGRAARVGDARFYGRRGIHRGKAHARALPLPELAHAHGDHIVSPARHRE